MAQALTCDLCGQENAQLVITNSDNGDVMAVGPSCVVVFYLTAAGEMLSMMPAENVAAYASMLAPVVERLTGLYLDEAPETGDLAVYGPDSDTGAPAPVSAAPDA